MNKITYTSTKTADELSSKIEEIINDDCSELKNITYNGRNNASNTYSFLFKDVAYNYKFDVQIKTNDQFNEIIITTSTINDKIKNIIDFFVKKIDSNLEIKTTKTEDKEEQVKIKKTITAEPVHFESIRSTNKAWLPKLLKIEAIVIFVLGFIGSILIANVKTIDYEPSYSIFAEPEVVTVKKFDPSIFLSGIIGTLTLSSILFGIGENLSVSFENNKILKEKIEKM